MTCLFEAAGDPRLAAVASQFRDSLAESGVPLRVAEAASGSRFVLATQPGDVRVDVDSSHRLWQKERLLNLAIDSLPPDADAVAWIDADIVLPPDWGRRVCDALAAKPIVQLFHEVSLEQPDAAPFVQRSLADALAAGVSILGTTPGHAWAARRDALPGGLFDQAILGGGDTLMAHAWNGCTSGRALMELPPSIRRAFIPWARQAWSAAGGRIGVVPLRITHRWHGAFSARHPVDRGRRLAAAGFDWARDIRLDVRPDRGVWQWTDPGSPPARAAAAYFDQRTA